MPPGYDMLSTALLMPEDTEELALTLNGKRRKIKRSDFEVAMNGCSLEKKIMDNLFSKFIKVTDKWLEFIDISFLPQEMKQQYKLIITRKLDLLKNSPGMQRGNNLFKKKKKKGSVIILGDLTHIWLLS